MAADDAQVRLTSAEVNALRMCLSGEIENDDGRHGDYMKALRRILKKLEAVDG